MDWRAHSDRLHARVVELIAAGADRARADFDELAIDIARFQARTVPAIQRLCDRAEVDLSRVTTADQIPAVVTDAHRFTRIAAHPPEADVRVFCTSGTTQGSERRGSHPMRTTATYEASLMAWGRAMLFPDGPPERAIVLCPSSAEAPDSSLSFMIDCFVADLGVGRTARAYSPARGADVAAIARGCLDARRSNQRAFVAGTSFAFVQLLDLVSDEDLTLPPGSRIMTTGGTKGRSRDVDAETLRRQLALRFGTPESHVVGEYGMTELSSQLYEPELAIALGAPLRAGRGAARAYVPPPWLRVTAVDPVSFAPVPEGEIGIARFVDLANVDSAVAVQTADRVRVRGGGVELCGRQPGAPPRGCSLALEHLLGGGEGDS